MARKKKSRQNRIGELHGMIGEQEKKLDKADRHERSIIEIGIRALRDELTKLQREERRY